MADRPDDKERKVERKEVEDSESSGDESVQNPVDTNLAE